MSLSPNPPLINRVSIILCIILKNYNVYYQSFCASSLRIIMYIKLLFLIICGVDSQSDNHRVLNSKYVITKYHDSSIKITVICKKTTKFFPRKSIQ